jgi:hypothetical protein
MTRSRSTLAALLVLVAALAGCTTTSADGTGSGAVAAETATGAVAAKKATAKPDVLKFLKANYSDAVWYSHITGAHQNGSVTWIETDLSASAKGAGAQICSAVSAWQFKQFHKFEGVTVRSADGNRLSRRIYLKDPC